ncbi:sigma-54-dependent Fis family transcriptional regulator [uncultured Hyphomicrobium sp.]|uniref:sigma-54-dependent Fis family transcriptional regulator n=1 Tax=uncultured Hyphomicrobium sp. TaxID=194373 RepID=UPI0025E507ED|nr:sigma-54-dependent Fis family transcriptional regulator [uncultured Hyphomicrobium sp.]
MSQNPIRTTGQQSGGDVIQASWNRCVQEYGLDPTMRRDVERVGDQNIRELRSRMEEILFESDATVAHLRHVARDADYCLLLSDATGIVVQGYADTTASQELVHEGLATGSRWNENMVGTNGIGTCIVSRRSVTVAGAAHYNQTLRAFTCTAAPIFAPDGRVAAVLDFSGRSVANSSECSFAHHIVREAAANISTTLFRKCHQNSCIVALSREPEAMPLALNALIATDESGRLLGATQEALSFLGVAELSDLGGLLIQDLWRVSLDDLKPLASHNVKLSGTDGADMYVTTFLPKKKAPRSPTSPSPSKSRAAGKSAPLALDRVAGSDPKMRHNVDLCRRLLDRDISLLLLGETGVGKDTFAKAIHLESNRAAKPYVAVNCAAIPETLLASELFGYAPGTFTGGLKTGRVGRIVASNGGTLFLDEIGDMPTDLQAHLLRVLEEREVSPLGAAEPIAVDVRIICATHRDLPQLVEAGRFRRDLYYRIKGAQIVVSPLRERSDILELVARIFEDELGAADAEKIVLSAEVQDLFRKYRWPGNLRELKNVIRWILSVHSDHVITLDHLPDELLAWSSSAKTDVTRHLAQVAGSQPSATLELAYERVEQEKIIDALKATKWCITTAAQTLGVSRATLHRKIRKYGIISPNQQD